MIRAAALLVPLALPAGAEPLRPAELPPPDYAGQQYVDSKGCLFTRAGRPGEVIWLPRVTRKGVPICGNPPSGRRVPVAGTAATDPAAPGATEAAKTAEDRLRQQGFPDAIVVRRD